MESTQDTEVSSAKEPGDIWEKFQEKRKKLRFSMPKGASTTDDQLEKMAKGEKLTAAGELRKIRTTLKGFSEQMFSR